MFQSTHPRGVRPTLLEQAGDSAMFQSTHPRGVRPLGQVARDLGGLVSIHAPAWGATLTDEQHAALIEVSIHAPAWGATKQDAAFALKAEFQSTHPRGVRHGSRYVEYLRYLGFNPRTRVGCDASLNGSRLRSLVSIHAPAWGATLQVPFSPYMTEVSIHAPAWGATGKLRQAGQMAYLVSIHAPAWGATVSMFYPVDSRD